MNINNRYLNLLTDATVSKILVYFVSFVFLGINIMLLSSGFYYFSFIPLILYLVYLYFTALDKVFFIAVFLTPVSFKLVFQEFNLAINLPSELLLFGIMIIFILKIIYENPLTKRFVTHPVSIFIILQFSWMFITVVTSQIPLVSAKYLIMQMWFVIPVFYFGHIVLFNKKRIYLFSLLLIISICITVFYTTIHHALHDFSRGISNLVMRPFYNDHTAYGAVLALMLPVTLGIALKSKMKEFTRFYFFFPSVLFMLGIYLSFSRATWLSLILAACFLFFLIFRVKFRWLLLSAITLSVLFYLNIDNIISYLEKNRQDSSRYFIEHVKSISNIRTDASNVERINRWNCAIRMFKDYPVFGTGPGTYQFLYAPYQKAKEKTIISTNFGDGGNAHSEYLTPLAERGFLGLIFFICLIVSVYITGIRAYNRLKDKELKMIIAVILTGLFSYLIHGFLNNFLDTVNASVIFWGFIAIIVNLSILSKQKNNEYNIDSTHLNEPEKID